MTLRSGIHVGVVAAAAVMAAGSCEGGGNSWQHSMLVSGLVVVPSVGEVFAPDAVLPRSPLRAAFLGNAPHHLSFGCGRAADSTELWTRPLGTAVARSV